MHERIYPDADFWLENVDRVKTFFKNAILPELLGKWFSRPVQVPVSSPSTLPTPSDSAGPAEPSREVYCYCKGPDAGDMIGCDREECVYKWFHLSCLKLKTFPRSKVWYCPDCRKLTKKAM